MDFWLGVLVGFVVGVFLIPMIFVIIVGRAVFKFKPQPRREYDRIRRYGRRIG